MAFTLKRTHKCNELRDTDIDKFVNLNGWVHNRRDHGGIIFIDLRDRYGLTQIVFDPKFDEKSHHEAEGLRREDVLAVRGKVFSRKEGMNNPNMETGKIEVYVDKLEIVSKAKTPPLEVDDRIVANEEQRLKYRYIDLRRPIMQRNLYLRHKLINSAREYFNKNDFMEIETPTLVRSTPEGARDFLVPSRVNSGKFYALPQSPQLYKQILMISGCDRYFQVAKCLRDEDLRADRQPEHTQFDFEMSFVDSEDIMEFTEGLYKHLFNSIGKNIEAPFVRLTYDEAIEKYGTDKPDLRFGLELADVTQIVKDCGFSVFKNACTTGGIVKAINPEYDFGRKEIDSLIEFSQSCGAKGMAWMRVTENGLESNIAKFFDDETKNELIKATGAKPGSILMFIADKKDTANKVIDSLRQEIAKRLDLIDENKYKFCWITDFPLFSWDEDAEKWAPEHHMFSMPKKEDIDIIKTDPGKVKGDLFDLVLNGVELGSGSIRIHDPDIQKKVMEVVGMDKSEAEQKFGFLLNAYQYGAPVHGGMGLGIDRLIVKMLGMNDIREVIAFPKNKAAQCPMDGSPSDVSTEQLRELHIKTELVKPELEKNNSKK
ncbi:MAG: aspartate--tRNA ligase [Nanobdellota archaeon]